MRNLCEEFKYFRGQPIEVISEGIKFCGIDVDSGDDSVTLIDRSGRLVHIEYRHIDAVIEPQMKLNRLCARDDCQCENSYDNGCRCDNRCDD